MPEPILSADTIVRNFPARTTGFLQRAPLVRAVDHVSLTLHPGETIALVGESGSGKSTIGRMLLGLDRPDEGTIRHEGADIATMNRTTWKRFRSNVQVVFQDTGASLNPRRTIGASIAIPLRYNLGLSTRAARAHVDALLERVQLAPAEFRDRLPHALSGGQRQRVGIARALASNPQVIVADEPVSALDVSVRAQILRLMRDLQQDGLATLFITHDLGVVRAIASRIVVLYRGAIMEQGPTKSVMSRPRHPYTRALLAAMPGTATPKPPPGSGHDLQGGCRYAARCPIAADICAQPPALRPAGASQAACHFAEDQPDG